jgi:hypothetical protein
MDRNGLRYLVTDYWYKARKQRRHLQSLNYKGNWAMALVCALITCSLHVIHTIYPLVLSICRQSIIRGARTEQNRPLTEAH